ncbi:MAG: preprotein translocase subunit SecE [Ruminococcaceae bacterium]|nr:preprotein translocase subunit SecE [Oscillospiraceae bacterium]
MSTETTKKSFFSKIKNYLKESKSEFKKIVWPAKKQIINNSIVVIIGILVCGLLVSAIDFIFTKGIGFIIGLF